MSNIPQINHPIDFIVYRIVAQLMYALYSMSYYNETQTTVHRRFELKLALDRGRSNHLECWPFYRPAQYIWTACFRESEEHRNGRGLDGSDNIIQVGSTT